MTINVENWIFAGLALGFLVPAFIASVGLGICTYIAFDKAMERIVKRFRRLKWRMS